MLSPVRELSTARLFLAVSVAALVAVAGLGAPALAAASTGGKHAPSPAPLVLSDPPAPPSIRVDGHRMTFTGAVSWRGAVLAGPRSVDVIITDGGSDACLAQAQRVVVRQTRHAVTILIAGYAAPEPAGPTILCAMAFAPHTRRVHLDAPLAGRPVIDAADRRTHPVVTGSSVPDAHGVPSPYREQGVQADDAVGTVTRTWFPPDPNTGQRITLVRGTPAVVAALGSPPGGVVASGIDVSGAPATVWHTDVDGDVTTVGWVTTTGAAEQLSVQGSAADHLSIDQAVAIARSVR